MIRLSMLCIGLKDWRWTGDWWSAEDNATSVNELVDNNSIPKVVTTNIDKDDISIVTKTTERRGGGDNKGNYEVD